MPECVLRLAIGLVLTALLVSCGDSPTAPAPPAPASSLTATAVQTGPRAVALTLVVVNPGTMPLVYSFSDSCQVDFAISASSSDVWTWSKHHACLQVLTELRIDPGQSRTFETTWDLRRDDGGVARPGTYAVRGSLRTDPPIQSRLSSFVVR